jgi:hypothetical protein
MRPASGAGPRRALAVAGRDGARLCDRSLTERERPPGLVPRRRLRHVDADPFGTRDRHDPERAGVLRPAPARAPAPGDAGQQSGASSI